MVLHMSLNDSGGTGEDNISDQETTPNGTAAFRPWLSGRDFYLSVVSLSFSLIITGVWGIVANSLVMATYLRIGFSESINISYFALSVSDTGVLVTAVWGALLNLLELFRADIPFRAMQISSPTMYWPAEGFEKTTSCITAYIALERCLSVLFPLHVKRFVTKRKTSAVIATLFAVVCFPASLGGIVISFYKWVWDPVRNKSILTSGLHPDPRLRIVYRVMHMYFSNVVHFIALIVIWITSIFLAIAMKQNIKSRLENFGQNSKNATQDRNERVIKTVLLIATAYLVFSTPRVVVNIASTTYQGFQLEGPYRRTYLVLIIVGVQLSLFNSSINLFIYMKMSSRFREIVRKLLHVV